MIHIISRSHQTNPIKFHSICGRIELFHRLAGVRNLWGREKGIVRAWLGYSPYIYLTEAAKVEVMPSLTHFNAIQNIKIREEKKNLSGGMLC